MGEYEYTPNTDVIRDAVTFERNRLGEPRTIKVEAFERWLAAHDAEVLQAAIDRVAAVPKSANGIGLPIVSLNAVMLALVGHGTPEPTTERAPVQSGAGKPAGSISWAEHVEAWEKYGRKHWQSAERIAERGGFGYNELLTYLGREPSTWLAGHIPPRPRPTAPEPTGENE